MSWTMRESTFKSRLIQQAHIEPGQRVLDLGCGTGTLTLMAKAQRPEADVVGIDADPTILEIAKAKSNAGGLEIEFEQGMSFELPFADASFDRVLSSLLFHHLSREAKSRTLKEIVRVLRPDGQLHIADWGMPRNSSSEFSSSPSNSWMASSPHLTTSSDCCPALSGKQDSRT